MPELRDDELVGMFEAFRVDSVREVRPAGVGAVRIGARRRRRTQAGVLAGVAVLLVVLPLAVWAAARPLAERPPVGNDPTLTTTASPVAAAIGDLSIFNIYGTPLTLGAWPDLPSARKCPRTVTLDNGTQSVGGDTYIEINHELVGFADVDGDKRNELLAVIHCTSYPVDALHDIQQVVAVSGGRGDPVRVLGQVIATSASVGRIESVVGRSDGSVLVVATDYGFAYGPVAQRAEQVFTFTGGRFVATGPGLAFGPNPYDVDLAVTADPLNFGPARAGVRKAALRVEVRNAGPNAAQRILVGISVPEEMVLPPQCETMGDDSSRTNTFDCYLGRVEPGASATLELTVTVPGSFSGGAIWLVTWQVFVEPYTITDVIAPEIAPDDNHVSEAITLG